MGIGTAPEAMTTDEIVALNRAHTFFSWSAQGAIDPIAIDRAEGVWLYTPEGQKILDFNSQLMSVNIGHGDRRVIDAITEQATKLQFVQPAFATEIRGRLGRKLAEITPGDIDKVFFTLGGAEAIENAIKLARHYTGRYKVLARYRDHPKVAHCVFNDENSGSTFRQWDKGVALARGEYAWIAESDDWSEPTQLQVLLDGIRSDDDCVLSYCQTYFVAPDGAINWQSRHRALSELVDGKAFVRLDAFTKTGNKQIKVKYAGSRKVRGTTEVIKIRVRRS